MGISFYTFQAISYLMDVCWGRIQASRSVPDTALYVCFFQLVLAGPIAPFRNDIFARAGSVGSG